MSKVIVIEGPDRVGKKTQTNLLKQTFMSYGMLATVVEVPIKSAVTYRVIYWMLQNGLAKMFPKIFQWFQYLNRKVFQVLKLPHLQEKYDVIILDRWSLSTIIYGNVTGVPESFTNKLAAGLLKPDYTIILNGESFAHKAEDSYEADIDLQRSVKIEYSKWAINNADQCVLIDCNQPKNVIMKKLKQALQQKRILPRY